MRDLRKSIGYKSQRLLLETTACRHEQQARSDTTGLRAVVRAPEDTVPPEMRSATRDSTAAVDVSSRAEVGSSSSKTRERSISARTSPRRCFSPVDNVEMLLLPQPSGRPRCSTSATA